MPRKLTALLLALLWSLLPRRADDAGLEYKVKAVCVLNAARFITWPAAAFKTAQSPFVIGVLGENPFGTLLEAAVKNETIRHRPIELRHLASVEDAKACQVVFVCRSEKRRLPAIFRVLENTSALTVSEIEGFTEAGGILGLSLENQKIHFDINPPAAHKAGLSIEPQFLMICRKKI